MFEEDQDKNKSSDGQKLLLSFFKLYQMVKIHQANNRLVVETIVDFRSALTAICRQSDGASIRILRGRFYLNHDRLSFTPALLVSVDKLIDILQKRGIHGIRFFDSEGRSDEEIVQFVKLVSQSGREKDPLTWLQVQLDTHNYNWIEFLAEPDQKNITSESSLDERFAGEGEDGRPGRKDTATDKQAPDEFLARKNYSPASLNMAQVTYSQVMASMARKTYSHALTSVLDMTGKQSLKKRVGIQKSKRVVQSMIEILTKDESILLGMSTIRNYDDYTYTHSVNVAILAMCVGRRLGLSRRLVEQLGLCGLFHDLGKVDVPLNLIIKNEALTDAEYEQIKMHSLNSVRQIVRLNADHALKARLLLPPFEHHLGVDLSGYPQTDRKAPLSLLGRILAVADNYDAMTSNRSYRQTPISPDVALKIMLEDAGTKLDPLVLKVFIKMIGVYPVGSLVVLDSREIGLAAETPDDADSGRPIVCLLRRDQGGKLSKGPFVNLSDKDPATGRFTRNILQCLHPFKFGIQPADYLV
ncbi:MAG: HD domain-containing protein [Candidatus Adiutrix sp.]|jgi:HD-GYP domain-containing protein (c-di-GMP phosphodiesterase class II)|nr:HD domain-containing protein [Candidatus Adiutrix sp.]